MTFPGLVAANNLADVASTDEAWNNLGRSVTSRVTTTNLLSRSEEFNLWTPNSIIVTPNATTAPDGSLTATKLEPITSFGFQGSVTFSSFSAVPSRALVIFSVYAKAAEMSSINMWISDTFTAGATRVTFNLTNQAITILSGAESLFSSSISDEGSGWYRVAIGKIMSEASIGSVRIWPFESSEIGPGKGIFVWGAQVEQSGFLTPYVKTTGAPASAVVDASIPIKANDIKALAGVRANSTADFVRIKGLTDLVQPRLSAADANASSGVALRDSALLKASPVSVGDYAISRGTLDAQSLLVNGVPLASLSGTPFSGSTATSPLLISSFNLPVNFRMSEAMASGTLAAPERAIPIESDPFILFAKAGQF